MRNWIINLSPTWSIISAIKKWDVCQGNGVAKHLERWKKMVTWSKKLGWIKDNPFANYQIKRKKFRREKLQIQALISIEEGYPSLALMFKLQRQGIHFCIRMRDDWWKEVRKMLQNGEKDKVVTFKLPKNEENKKLLEQYKVTDNRIKCRLIAIDIEDSDTVEILCTSASI